MKIGRVELVQIAGDTKGRSFALKQMKKSQVSKFSKVYGKIGVISFEKITFYTEILTRKVELWLFSLVSFVKKDHKTTFLVKISV